MVGAEPCKQQGRLENRRRPLSCVLRCGTRVFVLMLLLTQNRPTDFLIENVKPLLEKYGVSLYVCGHDHSLQHLQTGGVDYIVCGAGCKTDANRRHGSKVPSGSLKYAWGPDSGSISGNHHNGGFSYFEISGESIKMTFYDQDGTVLYNMEKAK